MVITRTPCGGAGGEVPLPTHNSPGKHKTFSVELPMLEDEQLLFGHSG